MAQATATLTRRAPLDDEVGGAGNGNGGMIDVASTRAAQEVQAAMMIAKRFPRDEQLALHRIKQACKRPGLAESATYEYARGGSKIEGASIRLAEVMARAWGNLEAGVVELERRDGESTAMAFAWDLETNFRDTKVFTVRHIRDKRDGPVKLKDERDIYELIANMGSRRKRACILSVIPPDVQDEALAECDKTLQGKNDEPLADRVRKMVDAFAQYGVTPEMIVTKLQHDLSATTPREVLRLGKMFNSIRDGMGKVEDFFEVAGGQQRDTSPLEERIANSKTPAPTSTQGTAATSEAERIIAESAACTNQARQQQGGEDGPDVSGADAEPPTDDLSTERLFIQAVEPIAKQQSVDPVTFDNAIKLLRVSHGIAGARRKDSDARNQLRAKIVAGKFDWKSAKVVG